MTVEEAIPEAEIREKFPVIYECTPEAYDKIVDNFLSSYPSVNRAEAVAWIRKVCINRFLESDEDW